ncbi:MAG: RNA polymerase sigma factor [Planctomycetota bacterium]
MTQTRVGFGHDDAEFAARAARGDRAALAALWEQHRGWIAALLVAYRPRGHELDDLMQEVALVLTQRIGDLKEPAAIRGWLRTVAHNVARGAARRPIPRPTPALPDAPDPLGEQRLHTVPEAREESDRALRVMESLPTDLREALALRCLQGWGQAEIARFLGVPETTVETRLARARRILRERLDPTRDGRMGKPIASP